MYIDESLGFKTHIQSLSARIRKVVGIIRNYRDVACKAAFKLVYYAPCQSLTLYCILCWGSAVKTFMVQAESAQQAVLKVMFRKPFKYPTLSVYSEAEVLNVRQLFILKTET